MSWDGGEDTPNCSRSLDDSSEHGWSAAKELVPLLGAVDVDPPDV
jgi:hypothetical protein